ncbi:MAG: peptidoglycan glycosyltransferase, partial [Firmicutes bacterium]|nr:peptidoglycan glycosyltransferase [Bacillota bacterium]
MKNKRRIKVRAGVAFILFVLMMIVLAGKVYYLKSNFGKEYETVAKNQQISRYDEMISPNRGSIVDRNNHPLALSTTVYNIVLDVRVLAEHDEKEQVKTCTALAEALGLDYGTLKGYTVKDASGKPALDTSWKVLAKQQTKEVKEALENQGLKGVVYQKDTKRRYPEGVMASQVVGFVRDAMWGLEKQYNSEMSGVPGRSFITYNGSEGAVGQEIPAEDGNTVVTTLDYQIQKFAQEAADTAMADFNAEYTAALVMNPQTGEIIAMAQTPTFDLNDPTNPIGKEDEEWDALDENSQYEYLNKTWKNFCVSDTFEPGSVFKPIVVAEALEQGIIRSDETFYCSGVKEVAGIPIRCHLRSGHGIQTVEDIIANSCNVGMMDIADRMGASLMYQCQTDFGVGSLTGIDLPAETDASRLMYAEEQIRSTELATMSFGQSFNTTIVQSATALSAVINGGNIIRPYVVSQVIDENGVVLSETKPEVVRKVISKETSDIVREFMVSTVEYGTGKKAKIDGY